jgi:hypothetical protein
MKKKQSSVKSRCPVPGRPRPASTRGHREASQPTTPSQPPAGARLSLRQAGPPVMPWNLKENPPESRRDGRPPSIHAVHRGPETPGRESRSWRAPQTQLAVQRPPREPWSRQPGPPIYLARFRCKIFCKMGNVAFSLLFGKYCLIMV